MPETGWILSNGEKSLPIRAVGNHSRRAGEEGTALFRIRLSSRGGVGIEKETEHVGANKVFSGVGGSKGRKGHPQKLHFFVGKILTQGEKIVQSDDLFFDPFLRKSGQRPRFARGAIEEKRLLFPRFPQSGKEASRAGKGHGKGVGILLQKGGTLSAEDHAGPDEEQGKIVHHQIPDSQRLQSQKRPPGADAETLLRLSVRRLQNLFPRPGESRADPDRFGKTGGLELLLEQSKGRVGESVEKFERDPALKEEEKKGSPPCFAARARPDLPVKEFQNEKKSDGEKGQKIPWKRIPHHLGKEWVTQELSLLVTQVLQKARWKRWQLLV